MKEKEKEMWERTMRSSDISRKRVTRVKEEGTSEEGIRKGDVQGHKQNEKGLKCVRMEREEWKEL